MNMRILSKQEKRENGKSKAYERKKERDMRELEYAQQEYARAKESAKKKEVQPNTIIKRLEKVVRCFHLRKQKEKRHEEMMNVLHMMNRMLDIMKKKCGLKKEHLA